MICATCCNSYQALLCPHMHMCTLHSIPQRIPGHSDYSATELVSAMDTAIVPRDVGTDYTYFDTSTVHFYNF